MVIDKNNLPDDPALLKEMLAELALKHENTLIEEQEKYQSLNHYQGCYDCLTSMILCCKNREMAVFCSLSPGTNEREREMAFGSFCGVGATTNLGLAGHPPFSYQQISTYQTMLNSGTKQHGFIKVLP